jgi:hypothetical protein
MAIVFVSAMVPLQQNWTVPPRATAARNPVSSHTVTTLDPMQTLVTVSVATWLVAEP